MNRQQKRLLEDLLEDSQLLLRRDDSLVLADALEDQGYQRLAEDVRRYVVRHHRRGSRRSRPPLLRAKRLRLASQIMRLIHPELEGREVVIDGLPVIFRYHPTVKQWGATIYSPTGRGGSIPGRSGKTFEEAYERTARALRNAGG